VIWDKGTFPEALRKHQLSDDTFPKDYYANGLCVLKRIKGQHDNYVMSIEGLSDIIRDALNGLPLPPLPHPVEFDQLASSFHNPGAVPYSLTISVFHEKGAQWCPGNGTLSVARCMDQAAKVLSTRWREIPPADLCGQLPNIAANLEAALVITDGAAAKKSPWSGVLACLGNASPPNLGMLIGTSGEVAIGQRRPVVVDVPGFTKFHGRFDASSATDLPDKISRIAESIRMSMIASTPAGKAEDTALKAAAASIGISMDSPPIVVGPTAGER
jgi:hypothetical protein